MHRSPSISPAESEFYGLSTGVCETLHVRQLMEELGHVFMAATQIFCDSRADRVTCSGTGPGGGSGHGGASGMRIGSTSSSNLPSMNASKVPSSSW